MSKAALLATKFVRINPNTDCWEWQRALSDTGYGVMWDGEKLVPAHRHYFESFKGPIPKGYDIDHLCRNECCVNPEHLEAVTRSTNTRRGKSAKLTAEQALEIRQLNAEGIGYRRLAKRFGVHRSTICHLITRRNWKAA